MGQAAALTGGYGSSYAQGAGQQAYSRYMQELMALLPEFEDRARSAYQQEGNDLRARYDLLDQREQNAYGRWQDDVSLWEKRLALAQEALLASYKDRMTPMQKRQFTLMLQGYDETASL